MSQWPTPGQPPNLYGGYSAYRPDGTAPKLDGISIAALVSSLTCCGAPVGIGLGIAGIVRTKDGNRSGRWAAVVGLALGTLITLAGIAFLVFAIVTGTRVIAEYDASVGQCLDIDNLLDEQVKAECGKPHDGEIVAVGVFDDELLERFDELSVDDFCAKVATLDPGYDAALASDDYEIGISVESFDESDPGSDDGFFCYVTRSDGEKLTDTVSGESAQAADDPSPRSNEPEKVAMTQLRVGDCFDSAELVSEDGDETLDSSLVTRLPCTRKHDLQLYATIVLKGDAYPGDKAVENAAKACRPRFEKFVGIDYDDSRLDYVFVYPVKESWERAGDRTIQCSVVDPDGKVSGTLKNRRR